MRFLFLLFLCVLAQGDYVVRRTFTQAGCNAPDLISVDNYQTGVCHTVEREGANSLTYSCTAGAPGRQQYSNAVCGTAQGPPETLQTTCQDDKDGGSTIWLCSATAVNPPSNYLTIDNSLISTSNGLCTNLNTGAFVLGKCYNFVRIVCQDTSNFLVNYYDGDCVSLYQQTTYPIGACQATVERYNWKLNDPLNLCASAIYAPTQNYPIASSTVTTQTGGAGVVLALTATNTNTGTTMNVGTVYLDTTGLPAGTQIVLTDVPANQIPNLPTTVSTLTGVCQGAQCSVNLKNKLHINSGASVTYSLKFPTPGGSGFTLVAFSIRITNKRAEVAQLLNLTTSTDGITINGTAPTGDFYIYVVAVNSTTSATTQSTTQTTTPATTQTTTQTTSQSTGQTTSQGLSTTAKSTSNGARIVPALFVVFVLLVAIFV